MIKINLRRRRDLLNAGAGERAAVDTVSNLLIRFNLDRVKELPLKGVIDTHCDRDGSNDRLG